MRLVTSTPAREPPFASHSFQRNQDETGGTTCLLSIRQAENEGDVFLRLHRFSVQKGGSVAPLAHRNHRGMRQGIRPADSVETLNFAVRADYDMQFHGSFKSRLPRIGRINWFHQI